jgi:FkbM family methyltransferase
MSLESLARALARRIFRGQVVRRRLPKSVGGAVVYVAPDSQLKHLLPGAAGLDHNLIAWAQTNVAAGDVVWDIGANCGVFALAAAGLGAEVLAVEPDPFLVNALLRARAANPRLRLEVLAAAIDGESGIATLEFASGGRASNALAGFAGRYVPFGRSTGRMLSPALRLDDLLSISVPTLVKLDIEGAELVALRGATRLLAEIRPTLIVEIDSGLWDEATAFLDDAGYRLFDPDDPGRTIVAPLFNVLARPKHARVAGESTDG